MKRIQEKVRDIVEVRAYESLQDFTANPAHTLAVYHFTPITSELMAKWIDFIAGVQMRGGAACALAGYRGVGKSHFLAALGAIVSQPEQRAKIADEHVAASLQRLKRRHFPVAFVKRGLRETLLEEIKIALSRTFEIEAANLSNSLPDLLAFAANKAGDLPFVLLIDTTFERTSRVLRDDGAMLGEIAEIAKELNIFVGVALDDDIAGADGVNAAIARSFRIDYLDQEHLYRIVDAHIFTKQRAAAPILHDIYNYFRAVMPNFRWSEQRFSSLYPLHPIILEIAPFVRLYAPEFALLGFASVAGKRILGRPANSLIGLDEVFDAAEVTLRKVSELSDAFIVYDQINNEVIAHLPIMERLQAKLILKALFLLSFEGVGTTAEEISASALVFDESESTRARQVIEILLEKFVSVFPNDIQRVEENGRETRYSIKGKNKESLNNDLMQASLTISADVIPGVLLRVARDKFPDLTISDAPDSSVNSMETQIVWRGGVRRGRVVWNLLNEADAFNDSTPADAIDWELTISTGENKQNDSPDENNLPKVLWQPAPLRQDELETILRFYVLLTVGEFREKYGEQIRGSVQSHALAVEKIWNRIFLNDGKLVIDGFDFNLTDDARSAQNLSELFLAMLEPMLEMRFPAHPFFARSLGMTEVSTLVNDFFSGARGNLDEVQKLVETFALPLGIVTLRGGVYALETEENLLNLPVAHEILKLIETAGEETVSLKTVYRELKKSPVGLAREAQHLILTALVAQRQIEFVTSKGDRINRRSLDLKIIWDDIEGIAKPIGTVYSAERLTNWAKILTASEDFHSIENSEDRETIYAALQNWLEDWRSARVLERFEELPDEILNNKIWCLATQAGKIFGSVAETVAAIVEKNISIDEGMHRVADAFSDSEDAFFSGTQDLVVVEDFINGAAKRSEIWTYLAVCEPTADEKIEYFRDKLLQIIEESYRHPSESLNHEMDNLWVTFQTRFSEYFAVKHDTVMKSHLFQEMFDEIFRSGEWWEFENLSRMPMFQMHYWKEAQTIRRHLQQLDCRCNVREMLKTHPFCACSFNLAQLKDLEMMPENLSEIVNLGRIAYRRNLFLLRETLLPLLEQFTSTSNNRELSAAGAHLVEIFRGGSNFPLMSNNELIVLQKILENLPVAPLLHLKMPEQNFTTREEMREKFNDWVGELPNEPVLLKI